MTTNKSIVISLIITVLLVPMSLLVVAQADLVSLHPVLEFTHLDTIYKTPNFHTAIHPYQASELRGYKLRIRNLLVGVETPSSHFYLNKHWLSFKLLGRKFVVRPIIAAEVGPIFTQAASYDKDRKVGFQDQQLGIQIEGDISNKLHIQAAARYGYWTPPEYMKPWVDSTHVMPHIGEYTSGDKYGYSGYDLFGYLSYSPTDYQNFQLGRGKNFIGDGYRSLILSDNAPAYWFGKSTTTLGRVKYQFMVAKMKDINRAVEQQYSSKYIISHVLSYNITKWLNVYVFENIIQQSSDTIGTRGFDINYLNPVAFLRPLEFNIGSPDNALLGIGGRIRLSQSWQIYGQFLLDELIIAELTQNRGWWGNKYAIQLGAKAFKPFGIKGLQILVEGNLVRPYTYSHGYMAETYGNMHMPLAHPLGANFVEGLLHMRYQRSRYGISLLYSLSEQGLDTTGKNYGSNIYKDYDTRTVPEDKQIILNTWEGEHDFGHELLQGDRTRITYTEAKVYVILNPSVQLIIEAGYRSRQTSGSDNPLDYSYGFFAIRSMLFRDNANK